MFLKTEFWNIAVMLKKLIIALMLTAAPFAQATAVLVCAMMEGRLVERCCCDHERHRACTASEDAALIDCCCFVTINARENVALDTAGRSADNKPFNNAWDSSPDPGTGQPQAFAAARHAGPQVPIFFQSHTDDGSRLYLLTARLRL